MLGGQLVDPLAELRDVLPCGQGELVVLLPGDGLGFGGAQRRVLLAGVAAAQFGVGGHGQLPVLAGGGLPLLPVGHGGGEDGLAFGVCVVHGLVAGRQRLLLGGLFVLAVAGGGGGFGAVADSSEAGAFSASWVFPGPDPRI